MAQFAGLKLGIVAIAVYVVGGIFAFGGMALIFFRKGEDLFGWGAGHTVGYLFLCVGVCLSIVGVLLMRIFRNRGCA